MKLAVIGGGWAGLAAAVRATQQGHEVTLYDMAGQLGGRAREVPVDQHLLDNGQHILIGAYRSSLDLLRTVGVDTEAALFRRPLELRYPDGRGLRAPPGPAWLGFGWGVLRCVGWTMADRLALLTAAARWALAGFRCDPAMTVDTLCLTLPPAVRELLIDPLCVAALNTPATEASAAVLLRVLRDALFGGTGSADLLLPRVSLSALLAQPAEAWLRQYSAQLRMSHRVQALSATGASWQVDGEIYEGVVLACTAAEAARLVAPSAPLWAERARRLRYEPIVTVYLQAAGARLPAPMTALVEGPQAPAQFAFDHGALGGRPGLFALVVSGAQPWIDRGLEVTAQAVLQQAASCLRGPSGERVTATVLKTLAEKRATFRCTPGLDRPPAAIASGLVAAGDYIAGPYPATLEGAVRSGDAAVAALGAARISA